MKKITPSFTPSLGVNWEQFGKASSLPGLLLARDLIDEQIRILQGDIHEPEEAPPPRRLHQPTPADKEDEQTIPLKGLTGRALEEARNHNHRIYASRSYAKKRNDRGSMSHHESGAISWAGMTAEERSKEMHRRIRVARENRARQAKSESGRRGAAKRQQKEKIARMTAARLAAKAEKEALVNGAA